MASEREERLEAVATAAQRWLIDEHGPLRPNHPADEIAGELFDALAALSEQPEDCGN